MEYVTIKNSKGEEGQAKRELKESNSMNPVDYAGHIFDSLQPGTLDSLDTSSGPLPFPVIYKKPHYNSRKNRDAMDCI